MAGDRYLELLSEIAEDAIVDLARELESSSEYEWFKDGDTVGLVKTGTLNAYLVIYIGDELYDFETSVEFDELLYGEEE